MSSTETASSSVWLGVIPWPETEPPTLAQVLLDEVKEDLMGQIQEMNKRARKLWGLP